MPDMTPQGLANAINALVEDLPPRRTKGNASWQRVLVEQALRRLLETNPELAALLEAGLVQLLRDEPALCGAVDEAFDVGNVGGPDDLVPGTSVEDLTDYATTPLARLLWKAATTIEKEDFDCLWAEEIQPWLDAHDHGSEG